jgi:hypothetical protein
MGRISRIFPEVSKWLMTGKRSFILLSVEQIQSEGKKKPGKSAGR